MTIVSIAPCWYIVFHSLFRFKCVWTGERFKQEFSALLFCYIYAVFICWNDIVSLLVVIVTEKIRLEKGS